MNERIKDILAQPVFERLNDWVNIGPVQRATLEEFTELIVKECATIILNNDIEKQEDYDVNHLFFNGWERGVIDSCQIIKKHFGVEE